MNAIPDFLSRVADAIDCYAREVCAALLIAALIAGGSYLYNLAKQNQDAQRTAINELTRAPLGTPGAQAVRSCAWLRTDGTNTTCEPAKDAP